MNTYSHVWTPLFDGKKYTKSLKQNSNFTPKKHIRMCEFVFFILENIQSHANEIITLSRIDMYKLVACEIQVNTKQIVFKKLARYPKDKIKLQSHHLNCVGITRLPNQTNPNLGSSLPPENIFVCANSYFLSYIIYKFMQMKS